MRRLRVRGGEAVAFTVAARGRARASSTGTCRAQHTRGLRAPPRAYERRVTGFLDTTLRPGREGAAVIS
jgi:hypothetical protein